MSYIPNRMYAPRFAKARKVVTKDPVQFAVLMKLSSLKEQVRSGDLEFARSLVTNFNKYGRLSDRQMYFVEQIIARAETPVTAPATIQVSVAQINDMFDKAAQKMKRIKVTLQDSAGQRVVFKRAGPSSKYSGQILVSDGGTFGQATFFGRIDQQGMFHTTQKTTDSVRALISEFAADPEDVAGKYGRLTGSCCFCTKSLDDPRSLNVGYGPVCAKHFGLKWGN